MVDLIMADEVTSQEDVRRLLLAEGHLVSQSTVSKDLTAIGAVRVRRPDGSLVYRIMEDQFYDPGASRQLARLCREYLVRAEASANMIVVHTRPSTAQFFALAVDRIGWREILGCVAGEDTVIIVARDPQGGQIIAERLTSLSHTEKEIA
jgi:transcriptional regulator of arginine metabolism